MGDRLFFVAVRFILCWVVFDVSFDKSLSSIGLSTDVMNVVFPGDVYRLLLDTLLEKPSVSDGWICMIRSSS